MAVDYATVVPGMQSHVTEPPATPWNNLRFSSGSRDLLDLVTDRPPVEVSSAVYPQFCLLQDRRPTFLAWPLSQHFHPDDLTMMGFYYAGYADCIRCFYCGVGLKSWAATDDVMTEHIRWRPNCGYLLNTKGRQFVHGVSQRLQIEDHDDVNSSTTNAAPVF